MKNTQEYHIDLALPVLLITVPNGILACGYFNIETFNTTEEACAIVTGVNDFDEMRKAEVEYVSDKAAELGVKVGETGESALAKMM